MAFSRTRISHQSEVGFIHILLTSVFQVSKDLETEQELNLSMRQGKQEWVSKVVKLESVVKQKDQVNRR